MQLDAARPDIVQRHAVKTRAGELDDPQARKALDGIVEEQAVAHDRLVSLRAVYRGAFVTMNEDLVPGSFQLLALAAIQLKRAGHQNVHAFIPLSQCSQRRRKPCGDSRQTAPASKRRSPAQRGGYPPLPR